MDPDEARAIARVTVQQWMAQNRTRLARVSP
jgi:hypothetical protein